jgi:putative peptidoglycan lipid II flippase
VATSLGAWINVALLGGALAREGTWRIGPALGGRLWRLFAASAVMGAALAFCAVNYRALSNLLWRKEVAILAVCALGAALYFVAGLALRAFSWRELIGALRREPGGPAADLPGGADG